MMFTSLTSLIYEQYESLLNIRCSQCYYIYIGDEHYEHKLHI